MYLKYQESKYLMQKDVPRDCYAIIYYIIRLTLLIY